MKVLVTGSRDLTDKDKVFATLDRLHSQRPIELIVHGGQLGADTLANEWADARKVPVKVYPADWKSHGRGAGPKRNAEMLEKEMPHGVVAFPEGGPGTRNMISQAQKVGVPVKVID